MRERYFKDVFAFDSYSVADTKPYLALYARCHMHITRICLPNHWNETLIDSESGRSVLPASLIALSLSYDFVRNKRRSIVYGAFAVSESR